MVPHVRQMRRAFEPGLNTINWLSVNIEPFLETVQKAVSDLELTVDRINDLVSSRIEAAVRLTAGELLCELPTTEPWTLDHFTSHTKVRLSLD
jgi:hypothetical protein